MTVKEIDGRWHTVNKAGKVGKRRFKTKESAQAAQDRGRARAAASPLDLGAGTPESTSGSSEDPDTSAERKKLGIPKRAERGEF